jgi:hypothetical protein
MRIAEVLRLPACQPDQPSLGLERNRGFSAGTRTIVQRGDRAFGHGPFDATLDRLMMQSEPASHRKKRWLLSISQQYPRPLHPACRFGSRLRYRPQVCRVLISERQLDRPPPRRHGVQPLVPNLLVYIWGLRGADESLPSDNLHGIDRLVMLRKQSLSPGLAGRASESPLKP